MREDYTPAERHLMKRWLEMSDEALREAGQGILSEHTRTCAAFDSGYVCALYLLGPGSLKRFVEHPSDEALREVSELVGVNMSAAVEFVEFRYSDPTRMPALSAMLEWAEVMRERVPIDRSKPLLEQ